MLLLSYGIEILGLVCRHSVVVVQGNSIQVMCETYSKEGALHPTNKRYSCDRIMERCVPLEVTILRVATLLHVTKVAHNFV